jgi:transcriptional regulator with XRE-family HTH domain
LYDRGVLPETVRLIDLLKVCLRILGISHREVARRLEMSPSYVSKLFSGSSEMRLDHLIRICEAVKLDPSEFFALAYPVPEKKSSAAAARLRALLRSLPIPPPPTKQEEDPEKLEAMLKSMLAKMLGQGGV